MVLMRLLIFIIFPLICLINNLSYSNNNVISANIELIQKDLIGTELTYVIKDKDTLINIARKYRISFADILSANGNMDPWLPKVDKKILLKRSLILRNFSKKILEDHQNKFIKSSRPVLFEYLKNKIYFFLYLYVLCMSTRMDDKLFQVLFFSNNF